MDDSELLDARQAMEMLGINEGELQALVARGDLRAFRSAGTMKFRRDDLSGLKHEKGTSPTIIVPSTGGRKGSSSVLPAVSKPGSRSTVKPGSGSGNQENTTGDILIDDIELVPTDDVANTQQVTAHQPAVSGDMTQVESSVAPESTAATAASPAVGKGSGRRPAQTGTGTSTPGVAAVSRLGPAVATSSRVTAAKRTTAVYEPKTAHPVMTAFMILTTVLFLYTASICGVLMFRGTYDKASGNRIIPPYLSQDSQLPVYRWTFHNTPGIPRDTKPASEYSGIEEKPK